MSNSLEKDHGHQLGKGCLSQTDQSMRNYVKLDVQVFSTNNNYNNYLLSVINCIKFKANMLFPLNLVL
jgi:hypothetical protein